MNSGYVSQCFYRNGDSADDVLEALEMFQFGKGTWEITEV
jgi:hypothetical protein